MSHIITAREAWICGTILGLFAMKGGVPGTDMTVHPQSDAFGNWNNRLEVHKSDGGIVAYITVTDAGEDDDLAR